MEGAATMFNKSNQAGPKGRLIGSLLLSLTFAGACLTACGGSSDKTAPLDPKRAAEQAHALLISPTDLPDSGWLVAQDDDFSFRSRKLASSSECSELTSLITDVQDVATAKAQRRIERPDPPYLSPITVTEEVEVYDPKAASPVGLKRYGDLATSGRLLTCFIDTLKLEPGQQPVGKMSAPSAIAPAGGVGFAYDFEVIVSSGRKVTFRREGFAWTKEQALVTLDIVAPKENVTAALVKAAVAQTSTAMDRGLKK
jgi:hypothetical protein